MRSYPAHRGACTDINTCDRFWSTTRAFSHDASYRLAAGRLIIPTVFISGVLAPRNTLFQHPLDIHWVDAILLLQHTVHSSLGLQIAIEGQGHLFAIPDN